MTSPDPAAQTAAPATATEPETTAENRKTPLAVACTLGVAAIMGYFLFTARTIRRGGTSGDFPVFYVAGQRLSAGENIYIKPEEAGEYIYPPLLAWVFSLGNGLTQAQSAWTWGVINLLMLSATLTLGSLFVTKRYGLRPTAASAAVVALLTLILAIDKSRLVISGGQTDFVTVLGVTLAMVWRDRRPWLAGLSLGAAGNIKYLPLLFTPVLVVRTQWKVLSATLLGCVLAGLLPVLTVGWSRTAEMWSIALGGVARLFGYDGGELFAGSIQDATHPLSISITSALTRAMTPDPGKNLALAIAGFLGLLTVGATWWLYLRAGLPMIRRAGVHRRASMLLSPVEWAGAVALLLAFSPQTQGRHLVLMIPFYLVAVAMLFRPTSAAGLAARAIRRSKGRLLVALLLAAAGMSLPPGGDTFREAQRWWGSVGGAGWCLLPAWFALLHLALRVIRLEGLNENELQNQSEIGPEPSLQADSA